MNKGGKMGAGRVLFDSENRKLTIVPDQPFVYQCSTCQGISQFGCLEVTAKENEVALLTNLESKEINILVEVTCSHCNCAQNILIHFGGIREATKKPDDSSS